MTSIPRPSIRLLRSAAVSWLVVALAAARVPAQIGAAAQAKSTSPKNAEPNAVVGVLESLERAQIDAIAKAEPSVVAIARRRIEVVRPARLPVGPFEPFPGSRGEEEVTDPQSPDFLPSEYGTGVVVHEDGLILTSYHVLGDPKENEYFVWIQHRPFKAKVHAVQKVVAADPWTDLAILQVPATGLKPITLGDGSKLRKGMFVIALGNPLGIARDGEASASFGIISNLARKAAPKPNRTSPLDTETVHELGTLIQTDARINHGSSGGALINLRGEMIGLTTLLAAAPGFERSAGFAIPVDAMFREVLEKLKTGRAPEFGFLGVGPLHLPLEQRRAGLFGARLNAVVPGTPAEVADLRAGDIITHVDGVAILDRNDLFRELGSRGAEAKVELTVVRARGGAPLPATMLARDSREVVSRQVVLSKKQVTSMRPSIAAAETPAWRGLRVDYATAVLLRLPRPPSGVDLTEVVGVVRVEPNSPAWKAGLRDGDFIQSVGKSHVSTPAKFQAAVADQDGAVELRVVGSDGQTTVRIVKAN